MSQVVSKMAHFKLFLSPWPFPQKEKMQQILKFPHKFTSHLLDILGDANAAIDEINHLDKVFFFKITRCQRRRPWRW